MSQDLPSELAQEVTGELPWPYPWQLGDCGVAPSLCDQILHLHEGCWQPPTVQREPRD